MQITERTKDASQARPLERGWLRDALWLARRDIAASWKSFPAAFVVAGVAGLLSVLQFGSALSGDMAGVGEFLLDLHFVCLVCLLGAGMLFNDYKTSFKGFEERLSFLRVMPVRVRAIIAGRVFGTLASLACAAPPFFLVAYLVSEPLRGAVGVGEYLVFCGFWVGYAMAATGWFFVFGSFGFGWESVRPPLLVTVSLGFFILLPVALNLIFAKGLTMTMLGASGSGGMFVALASLVVGAGSLLLSARMSERRLQRRDVG